MIPANIGKDVCPGGIVVIHFDTEANILRQSNLLPGGSQREAAEADALYARAYPGKIITCFYDGDTGDPFAPAIISDRDE